MVQQFKQWKFHFWNLSTFTKFTSKFKYRKTEQNFINSLRKKNQDILTGILNLESLSAVYFSFLHLLEVKLQKQYHKYNDNFNAAALNNYRNLEQYLFSETKSLLFY